MKFALSMRLCCALAAASLLPAEDFTLPPLKTVLQVDHEAIPVVVTGTVSQPTGSPQQDPFRLKLNVDLAGLQEHLTGLLRARLDQSNRCGERLSVEQAAIAPAAPAASLTANVHFEKWACAKAFGKDLAKKLIAGNGTIQVRLTATVEQHRSVKLESSVVSIEADGPLGDVLRSGSLGDSLREKIRASVQSALEKAVNLEAALPPALAAVASIQSVQFRDTGGGRLASEVVGEAHLSGRQMHDIIEQLKNR